MATNIYPVPNALMQPVEILNDPVNKLRVSMPQALIDTDFEYGTQTTKWESVGLTNNRPFSYQSPTPISGVTAMTMNANARIVTVATITPPAVGTPITVQDSYLSIANGNFLVESVVAGTSFTYTGRANNATSITAIFDSNKTAIFSGSLYTGAAIGGAPTVAVSGTDLKVSVTTTIPHGLSLGNEIAITGITGTLPPNGSFVVATIISPTTFVYYANPTIGIPSALTATSAIVYVRPQSQFLHRAFDGGVMFSSNGTSNYEQAIRQTRRYFRYQSGKGIQISTGTVLKPYSTIESLSSSGTLVTVQTREQHNIQPGTQITISGANETAYNGTFTVTNITGYNTFTYVALSTPSATPASGAYAVSVVSWQGALNRLGTFDSQNGLLWQFDGQNLSAIRRSSTFQASGKVTVTNGSATITQTNASFPSAFSKQLIPGDWIVLRGQTYRVVDIASDTSMTISPAYRGSTASYAVLSKITETEVLQSQFNLDKLDGTGPSGYNIDLSKMQMFYIDYSWYGAGFIRWGVRGPNGDIIYAHKMPNNNVNTEAYMRSGNLPARYESTTQPDITTITASIGASDTSITVKDTTPFASSGTLMIRPGSATNQAALLPEYVNYTGKTATTFTGLTRALAGSAVAGTATTWTSGSNNGTVTTATGIQVGQRVFSSTSPSPIPDGTFVVSVVGSAVTLSQAVTAANPNMIFAPMGATAGTAYTYSATSPTAVEYAYPTFAPAISHWGTSIIMDGRFDDDKSLIFTYGQTAFSNIPTSTVATTTSTQATIGSNTIVVASGTGILLGMVVTAVGIQTGTVVTNVAGTTITLSLPITAALSATSTTFTGGNTKALFSIRVAPSVDSGISAAFGARELINRMQLKLSTLDISTKTTGANMLVRAYINGIPSASTVWTNAVGNAVGAVNSSLAQIADHGTSAVIVSGGEITGGYFVATTGTTDLTSLRDLGNSILGGGTTTANSGVYPDGPDTVTIVVTNLGAAAVDVLGRISWTEAQA